VELTNTNRSDVIVLGYDGEPYLRIGSRGVYENFRSPSHFLNRGQPAAFTSTTLPPAASPDAPPDWHRKSGRHVVRWRDRRTRWEGSPPGIVRLEPNRAHALSAWTIGLRRGARKAEVRGTLLWAPGPSATPWLIVAAWLVLITVAVSRLRAFGSPLAVITFALVVADVVHTVAQVGASRDGLGILAVRVLLGGVFSLAAWIVGLAALRSLAANREGGVFAAGIAAFFIAMLTGIGDSSALGHSQIPSLLSPPTVRALVATTLGLGLGVVIAALLIGWRSGWWATIRAAPLTHSGDAQEP
jgi:hypothetical protein